MKNLESELKELVITTLSLEKLKAADIITENPLFVDGLGLDSIDALELGVAIKKKYKVALDIGEDADVKKHFFSIRTLADFIQNSSKATK